MVINGRTDLASEARAMLGPGAGALPGVRAAQEKLFGLPVSAVEILDEEGAARLKKPRGRYFSLELPAAVSRGSASFADAAQAVAALLRRCLPAQRPRGVLIAALGNPDITPDALGPLAAESILVTRHLKRSEPALFGRFCSTLLLRTGVLGTTGLESAQQIRALCRQFRPDLILAIDALAGSDPERLCLSVQICDSGIAPGSGVGNDREAISRETMGLPVVALGVPTVIDAASLGSDNSLSSFFLTPRGIDSMVRSAARVLGYGIDLALHEGLRVEDVDALIS